VSRTATTGLLLLAVLTACSGGSSGQNLGRASNDLELQAARNAAIGGCQEVAIAEGAPPTQGASSGELQAIQDAFNSSPGPVYPGAGQLLRALLDASTPAAKTQAVHKLQQWCVSRGFAATR
jgi:hypothetical protein